jgi:hypothetical protein
LAHHLRDGVLFWILNNAKSFAHQPPYSDSVRRVKKEWNSCPLVGRALALFLQCRESRGRLHTGCCSKRFRAKLSMVNRTYVFLRSSVSGSSVTSAFLPSAFCFWPMMRLGK